MADSVFADQPSGFKPDLGNLQVGNALNIANVLQNSKSGQATLLPWSTLPSPFFKSIEIDPVRWDQLFPYRLLVIDTANGNKTVNGSTIAQTTVKGDNTSPIVAFQAIGQQWVFTFPITPQQFNIIDQYAIGTSATLRGIVEEHNGLKFKSISMAGTFGVWPYRQDVTSPPQSPTILQSVFGGTIEAATNVVSQFQRVINIATGNSPNSKPARKGPETSGEGVGSTGYYQIMALAQLIEQYAEAKKNPANAGWRMVLDIPKQNQSLIVTPINFHWIQSSTKPMEFMYNLQLKAWRRIDLQQKVPAVVSTIQPISPGILQRVLGAISAARSTASAALTLISSVRSDIEAPLTALRQTALLVKDLAGVAVTVADLPAQVINDYKSSINASMNILANSIATTSSDPAVRNPLAAVVASQSVNEGLTIDAVSGGQIGAKAATAVTINPANNIYANSNANFDLLDQVPVTSLSLTVAQQAVIDNVIAQARQTTVAQLKQFRQTILGLALQLSNSFGAGDAFYNKVYGLPPPTPRIQPMTLDEYDILAALYQSIQSYDLLTATREIDDNQIQSNMDYVAGLADLSGIEFNTTVAKILVPVPFGLNVEQIAARYLQDPQRWLEIVTLNNLKDPYIDENGFQVPLLSNASGRNITIGSITDLYIGQRVIVQSATQQPSARVILGIDTLSSTSFLITLDGMPNLDNFLIADQAYLQAYLPGTVNSQQKIFIPSDLPLSNNPDIVVPQASLSDPLTGLSKVDLLLTDSGDLAVNNFGDFRFAYGMTNIIQALKIKIGTQAGKVLTHPDFGLGIKVGMINSDFNVEDTFNSMNKLIQQDPRFSGINNLQINLNGPTLSLNMAVALAGIQGVFPVNFVVPT
jgi:hypothetical protein